MISFGWASLSAWIQGFRGAVVVMTLGLYPLVYFPVAASLRGADPGQEEVARSLGTGRVRTFLRITLGQARGAILGGCLLVAMVLLAEYGAFEIVGYQTFTTEIFTEVNQAFSLPAAAPQDLYARPVNADMARFIGDANLVEGILDGAAVDTLLGGLPVEREARLRRRARSPSSSARSRSSWRRPVGPGQARAPGGGPGGSLATATTGTTPWSG